MSAVTAPGEKARIFGGAAQGVAFVDGFLIFRFGVAVIDHATARLIYSFWSFSTAVRSAMQKSISPLAAK